MTWLDQMICTNIEYFLIYKNWKNNSLYVTIYFTYYIYIIRAKMSLVVANTTVEDILSTHLLNSLEETKYVLSNGKTVNPAEKKVIYIRHKFI